MPELPEVETIVRGLAPVLIGRRLEGVWTSGKALRLARAVDARGLRAVVEGARVRDVRRVGKYITLILDDGSSSSTRRRSSAAATGGGQGGRRGAVDGLSRQPPLAAPGGPPSSIDDTRGVCVHLGMTGRLRVQRADEPRAPHTHVVFTLDRNEELRFADARRFGFVAPGDPLAALPALAVLGPDPLRDLDGGALARAMTGVRAPLKAFLLDQKRIAGIGNIYACEAMFLARLHPRLPTHRARGRAEALLAAIRETLEGGIARRGTTLRDYVDADGFAGDNAGALQVYGREGEPCVVCGRAVRRQIDAARSTFFCAHCQKR
ncbi:MAG TPA: bifunctional DNA-formamidopyrimidine glycosylase/DNA-(apurinic or apyrimidinic site) lyase [Polyangia bacterium]|nr:bifunctional DNA-formamidopyrimidine glycosylase/DNA-(apurinic or apyrimidinic site) lyase [Polyangia bacterium]